MEIRKVEPVYKGVKKRPVIYTSKQKVYRKGDILDISTLAWKMAKETKELRCYIKEVRKD